MPEKKEEQNKKEVVFSKPQEEKKVIERAMIKKESAPDKTVAEKKEGKKPEVLGFVRSKEKVEKKIKIKSSTIKQKQPTLTQAVSSKSVVKKEIRRSAMDLKMAQEVEESKRLTQEEEWEIPAFLRRTKFKV